MGLCGLVKFSGWTEEEAIGFIREARGNIALASQMMGINRTTLTHYIMDDWPLAKEALLEAREKTKDTVEHRLIDKALEGDMTAIIFYLKTQARDRGYTESTRTENVNVNLDVTKLTEDQLRRIANGEDVARVISGAAAA